MPFRACGTNEVELVFGQASNCQFAEQLAVWQECIAEAESANFWQLGADDVVEEGKCAWARNFNFGEAGKVEQRNGVTCGVTFFGNNFAPTVFAEERQCVVGDFALWIEIRWALPTTASTKCSTLCLQLVVQGRHV